MKLLLDLLAMQGQDAERGIGRGYMAQSLELQEQLRVAGDEMELLAYPLCPDKLPYLKNTFAGAKMHQLQLAGLDSSKAALRAADTLLIEDAYRQSDADVIYLGSLFEGAFGKIALPRDYRVTGKFVVATVHDLIPMLFPDKYLRSEEARVAYEQGLERLKSCDLLLTDSENTRQDVIKHLQIAPERVKAAFYAVSDYFCCREVRDADKLLARYGIKGRFVMYTGGADWRKNTEGLVEAWAKLSPLVRRTRQLVIVCAADAAYREHLLGLAQACGLHPGELVLTGFVPDEDLVALYNLTELFVFPSLYEGFGLPILEAMRCGAVVLGADNSSIRELIVKPESLFNAEDTEAIAAAVERGVKDEGLRRELKDWGRQRSAEFTWKRSAELAVAAMREGLARKESMQGGRKQASRLQTLRAKAAPKRLAWVSPVPPDHSGIAAYTDALVPYLRERYEVDVFTKVSGSEAMPALEYPVYDWHELPDKAMDYDLIVYQMGNSTYHDYMLSLMECFPGLVTLHDFYLGNMIHACAHENPEHQANLLADHVFYSHGWRGLINLEWWGAAKTYHDYPANKRVLDMALGVIFHSNYNLGLCRKFYGEDYAHKLHAAVVPMVTLRQKEFDTKCCKEVHSSLRKKYGLRDDDFLVVSFGNLTPAKRNEILLKATAWLQKEGRAEGLRVVFAGEPANESYAQKLQARLATLPDSSCVEITGYLDDTAYMDYLEMADMAVQLRGDTRGETSGTIPECIMLGVPVILNAYATFNEWPDETVCKLSAKPTAEELGKAIDSLRRDEARRKLQAEKALEYLQEKHNPKRIAELYGEQIELACERKQLRETGQDDFLIAAGEALADMDLSEEDFLRVAKCYEQYHAQPGWRRLYACLPDMELGKLYDSVPDVLRDNPLCELVQCSWEDTRQKLVVNLRTAGGGSRSCDVKLTPWDCVLLGHEALQQPALVSYAVSQLAQVYAVSESDLRGIESSVRRQIAATVSPAHLRDFWSLGWALNGEYPGKGRILIDTTYFTYAPERTGIWRLCWELEREMLAASEKAVLVRFVNGQLVTNKAYEQAVLSGDPEGWEMVGSIPQEQYVKLSEGDTLFLLDPAWTHLKDARKAAMEAHKAGARIFNMLHDIFPLTLYKYFGREKPDETFSAWFKFAVCDCDGLLCNSRHTADEAVRWAEKHSLCAEKDRAAEIYAFPLGATALKEDEQIRPALEAYLAGEEPVFLMVGTVEPRKGHLVALEAFQKLWAKGVKARLLIIGHDGWANDEIISRVESEPGYGRHLLWLNDANDAELAYSYRHASCFLAASRDEGYCFPIVEAASYGLPLLCSDIPIFHETSQEQADFFPVFDASGLCQAIEDWLAADSHLEPENVRIYSWAESAQAALRVLQGKDEPYRILLGAEDRK